MNIVMLYGVLWANFWGVIRITEKTFQALSGTVDAGADIGIPVDRDGVRYGINLLVPDRAADQPQIELIIDLQNRSQQMLDTLLNMPEAYAVQL